MGAEADAGYDDQIEIVVIVCWVKGASIVGKLGEKKEPQYGDLEMVG